MDFVNEPEATVTMRKYRSILAVCGRGIMVFGLWSIVKLMMYLFLFEDYFQFSQFSAFVKIILYAILGTILAVDLILRGIIWTSAVKVSQGKKKKFKYLIVVILLLLASIAGISGFFFTTTISTVNIGDFIVSLFIELTGTIALIEVLICSLKIRKAAHCTEVTHAA